MGEDAISYGFDRRPTSSNLAVRVAHPALVRIVPIGSKHGARDRDKQDSCNYRCERAHVTPVARVKSILITNAMMDIIQCRELRSTLDRIAFQVFG